MICSDLRMSRITASIILPTYNESGNIIPLIERIKTELDRKKMSFEVVVVDDNSPDNTGLLVQKYFSKLPHVRTIIRKKERGLATAIRHGIEHAVGTIVVVMDTDFNHDPKLIPKLVEKCKKFDIVVGSRYVRGGGMANKTRERLSWIFNVFIKLILQSPVSDNLSGYFAMKRENLEKLKFDKIFWGYGDYFTRLIFYAKKNKNSFHELPSFYKNRMYGESKSRFVSMFYSYLTEGLKLRFFQ